MKERELAEFRISPRKVLKPASTFRTIRGSGPTYEKHPIGVFGKFVCRRIFSVGQRIYLEAVDVESGMSHILFIKGPVRTSKNGVREKPYRLSLT